MTTTPETLDTKSLEDGRGHSPDSVVVDQTKQKQSWLGWLWDTSDLGREERHLLFKLDGLSSATSQTFVPIADEATLLIQQSY